MLSIYVLFILGLLKSSFGFFLCHLTKIFNILKYLKILSAISTKFDHKMDWEHTVDRITQIDFGITVAIASKIVFGLKGLEHYDYLHY